MRYGSIYLITNVLDNKKYIGLTTTTVYARWASHKCNSSTCTYLHKALNKHGFSNFIVEELASSWSKENLEFLESYFIQHYDCIAPKGYNLTTGGGFHGKQSDLTKNLKSEAHKTIWKLHERNPKYKEKRMSGITEYIKNKKCKIIGISLSTGKVTRYSSFYDSGYNNGNIYTAIKKQSYYRNCLWFYESNQTDKELLDILLKKLHNRLQPENENPVIGENLETGEIVEFNNIFDAKKVAKDAGLIRKCLTGRLNRTKNWKFRLKV